MKLYEQNPCKKTDILLTRLLRNLLRRIIICIRAICCFPIDKIVPAESLRGNRMSLRPGVSQTVGILQERKDATDSKTQLRPRSRVSINEYVKVRKEVSVRSMKRKRSKCCFFRGRSKKKMDLDSECFVGKTTSRKSEEKRRGSLKGADSVKSRKDSRHENLWGWVKTITKIKEIQRESKQEENLPSTYPIDNEWAGDGITLPQYSKRPVSHLRALGLKNNYSDSYIEFIKRPKILQSDLIRLQ